MLATFVTIIHVFVCGVLMFVVLLQQGKGGGMGSAFGGASAQVFGGSGAGNILTRATAICAALFMLSSVWLAHHSSATDSGLRAKIAEQEKETKSRGEKRAKSDATPAPSSPAGSAAPAPSTSGGGSINDRMNAPTPPTSDSAPKP
jgi:preprotein translocase subunit SecG